MPTNGMKQKRIYLDHAATTPVDPRVLRAMLPYFSEDFGNPGSIHKEGVAAKKAVEASRARIAAIMRALPDEIIFTSGGTEANNMAIRGFAMNLLRVGCAPKERHYITSAIEHPSVLDCFKALEEEGAAVSYAPVTKEGIIDLRAFERLLRPETVLVSIMYANNEIGTVQPVHEISKLLARKRKMHFFSILDTRYSIPFLHTDASQAPLYLSLDVKKLGVDMLTLDAQKIYGPKGVGLLYARKGTPLEPLFCGGKQERGLRPGTENVPGIIGLAEALVIAAAERARESARLAKLRDYGIAKIIAACPEAALNGSATERIPNSINISFPGKESEWLVLSLDAKGIAVGARSACTSDDAAGSHVITALGKGKEFSTSSIRITLGRWTTRKDIDALADALQKITGA